MVSFLLVETLDVAGQVLVLTQQNADVTLLTAFLLHYTPTHQSMFLQYRLSSKIWKIKYQNRKLGRISVII